MTIISLAVFEDYIRTEIGAQDTQHNQSALSAAEAAINNACQRQFALAGAASPRSFAPTGDSDTLPIDDCTSITSVVENGTAVSASNYQAEPLNSLSASGETVPFDQLRKLGGIWYPLYHGQATVVVTATWGWASIPYIVVEACKLTGKALIELRNARGGVVTSDAFGQVHAPRDVLSQVGPLLGSYWSVDAFGFA